MFIRLEAITILGVTKGALNEIYNIDSFLASVTAA
jgi:hypothetical protein